MLVVLVTPPDGQESSCQGSKVTHAIGKLVGTQIGGQLKGTTFDYEALAQGFAAGETGDDTVMSIHDAGHIYEAAVQQIAQMAAAKAAEEGAAFLEENAKREGVIGGEQ